MAKLPYPGGIRDKSRVNLDAINYVNPYQTIYFQFDVTITSSRLIAIIPKDALIYNALCQVQEVFTTRNTKLRIGTIDNSSSIGVFDLMNEGVRFIETFGLNWGKILMEDTPVYASIAIPSGESVNTRGRGYGIINYLNMPLIPSFQKVVQ